MTILEEQRTRLYLNVTIYNETKFSRCHIPHTNNIFHPVSSYHFLSHKKLFQTSNCNVNVRPDLLYFSIWGAHLKTYQKQIMAMKTAKTLCTSPRRLVWWNVIHTTKISVVLLGQKILNAPRIKRERREESGEKTKFPSFHTFFYGDYATRSTWLRCA